MSTLSRARQAIATLLGVGQRSQTILPLTPFPEDEWIDGIENICSAFGVYFERRPLLCRLRVTWWSFYPRRVWIENWKDWVMVKVDPGGIGQG
ncbi:hypothetical protein CDAR_46411 [Caerostris darwini]|uniref:Uncharacterized protein n=1 Tax=Caerostris darwini TaxID=1538125 RepID=A0AAV4PY03_9ARAC|nr:hypothetical protein CDAR_46411 [Caerostris darwini]